MGTTAAKIGDRGAPLADSSPARLFHWVVAGLVLGVLAMTIPSSLATGVQPLDVGLWVAASLLADLMFVRIGKSITLSMSLPVLLAAAYFHSTPVTGLIAFLGCLDPRELRGEASIERILFNRSQIALSAGAASLVMYLSPSAMLSWSEIMRLSALGLAVDCLVNVALVSTSTVLSGRASWGDTLKGLWGAEPWSSLGLYASMCLIAPLLGLIYVDWGGWALLSCTAILIPFRLAFARIERLGLTLDIVKLREAALKEAYSSAELERRDERLVLAGDLHDELLPALFKVHLMGEVLKQDLASGRLLELDEDLPELLEATNTAQVVARRFVGDLRVKRLGSRGLVSAIRSCADQQEGDERPRFELRLSQVHGSERAELVLLQVAREAMVNASRYSNSTRIQVELSERPVGWGEVTIADDGDGFELASVDSTAHFGLQLMRERVESVGGLLTIKAAAGSGTRVIALVPLRGSETSYESDAI